MQVTIVHISVKPGHVDEFIAATRLNHEGSVREPGNLRFDVLQVANNPARFVLYEAFTDVNAAAAHKLTSHYIKWRDTVAPWMAVPREGKNYVGIFPATQVPHE